MESKIPIFVIRSEHFNLPNELPERWKEYAERACDVDIVFVPEMFDECVKKLEKKLEKYKK